VLTGKIVQLRTVRSEDWPALYELSVEFANWEERRSEPAQPLARETFDERMVKTRDDPNHVTFAVTVEDELIGTCSLFHEDALVRQAELGVALRLDAAGKGYGTDAVRVLIDYAFTRRNLRRVYLGVLASNERAIASYRKVGFVEEGRLREHAWVRGAYDDEVLMGLLRSEWLAVRER
jgi:RimJ/RimL family protein N-acetyltransferase